MDTIPRPDTDYFEMVLLTDPTFGEANPVFFLRTDDKNAYYVQPDVYLAIIRSNSLEQLKTKRFYSPYNEQSIDNLSPELSDQIMFTSTIDLNWFFHSKCSVVPTENGIVIESFAKRAGRPFKSFHFTFSGWHNEPELKNHLSLLYFFSVNQNPLNFGFYKAKKYLFPVELTTFSIDFPALFKTDLFYYFDLYVKHVISKEELIKFHLISLFDSDKKNKQAGELLALYFDSKKNQ